MVQVAASKRDGGQLREKPQQIADELRALIVSGKLSEGESIGREPDLVERFGVSRPSLREALRILEAEGLITVVRGVYGGVIVHEPSQRMTARTASLVLRARNVSLADVFEARALVEPLAARMIAVQARPARRRHRAEQLGRQRRSSRSKTRRRLRSRTRRSTSGSSRSAGTRRSPSSPRCSTRSWSVPSPR